MDSCSRKEQLTARIDDFQAIDTLSISIEVKSRTGKGLGGQGQGHSQGESHFLV
jgi:hypothetical protein